jgi:putative ATPase
MAVEDIGLADPQALVICNAAKDAYDFLGSSRRRTRLAQAGDLSRHRAEIERRLYGLQGRDAGCEGGRLAAAAEAHPQLADQADEVRRLRRRVRNTTTTTRSLSPARDYFPEALGRQTFYDPPERGFEREIASGWMRPSRS